MPPSLTLSLTIHPPIAPPPFSLSLSLSLPYSLPPYLSSSRFTSFLFLLSHPLFIPPLSIPIILYHFLTFPHSLPPFPSLSSSLPSSLVPPSPISSHSIPPSLSSSLTHTESHPPLSLSLHPFLSISPSIPHIPSPTPLLGVEPNYLPSFRGLFLATFGPQTPAKGCGGDFPHHKSDDRSYVNVRFFCPRRQPSIIYEGIVLQLCIILREETVKE